MSNPVTCTTKAILVLVVIFIATGLGESPASAQSQNAKQQGQQAQSQTAATSPCNPNATASSGSTASQDAAKAGAAAKNAANAVANLGSLFGKKKPAAQPASTNQPANQSADASAVCNPEVNAAAGAAAGVASTVDAVSGAPTAGSAGVTPGITATPATPVTPSQPSAKASATRAVPAATPASAATQPALATQPSPAPAARQPAGAAAPPAGANTPSASAASPNFSKLPDIQGIRLGMTADEVLPKLKALYPGAPPRTIVEVSYAKFRDTQDKPWVDFVKVTVNGQNDNGLGCTGPCMELIFVAFNYPPQQPRVVEVTRSLQFANGQQTTVANMKTALRQKYGQDSGQTMQPGKLFWELDEQGNALSDSRSPYQGGGQCVNAILVNPVAGTLSSPVAISGPGDATPVDLKNPLHSNVCVSADFGGGGPNAFVSVLNVAITENALDARTYVATQAFLDNIANQQQQQQIEKAQGTAAPKL